MSFEDGFLRIMLHGERLCNLKMSQGDIQKWKFKKQIKALESATGNDLVSLFIIPTDDIAQVTKRLGDLCGTVSNNNQESLLGAVTSAVQRLQLRNMVPPTGLVLYTGTIVEDNQEKMVTQEFWPVRPITSSFCALDNKFYTEALHELLFDDDKYGFLVVNGSGVLFGTLSYNVKETLHRFSVNLPKSYYGGGGHSDVGFACLWMTERDNYVGKITELATKFFINPETKEANICKLILAGSPYFLYKLKGLLDLRLSSIVQNVVEIGYGGETGFSEAIFLSAEVLEQSKYIREIHLIRFYFYEMSQGSGKYVHGVNATMCALELNSVILLLVWEDLSINRYVFMNNATGVWSIRYLSKDQEADQNNFRDPVTNAQLKVVQKKCLTDWLLYLDDIGVNFEFVTNKSPEGSQFCIGFGGIGGILNCQLDDIVSDDEEE